MGVLYKNKHANQGQVECDVRTSEFCKNIFNVTYDTARKYKTKVIRCEECYYETLTGRTNPNTKYANINDNMFANIIDEDIAYLLGWIASDGHVSKTGFTVSIHKKDISTLQRLRDLVCKELPITSVANSNCLMLQVYSKEMSKDICKWLSILPGKKSDIVRFPNTLSNNELKWAFLRGYFDGDGSISKAGGKKRFPSCKLTSNSSLMLEDINNFCQITCSINNGNIEWSGTNAIDLMAKLYDTASMYLPRKRDRYLDWSVWVPSLSGAGNHGSVKNVFYWNKSDPNAVPPTKNRASDLGYDLTIIKEAKRLGKVVLYDTGIKVQPEHGVFFMMAPRSSISKTGYILANSIGIIDKSYVGNVMVPLIKIDDSMPDLELPLRIAQLIPMPGIHLVPIEVNLLEDTERAEKGFGSSGR